MKFKSILLLAICALLLVSLPVFASAEGVAADVETVDCGRPGYDADCGHDHDHGHHDRPDCSRPAYSKPDCTRPAYSKPAYSKPDCTRPAYSKPAYSKPTWSMPSWSMPTWSHPTWSHPTWSYPAWSYPTWSFPCCPPCETPAPNPDNPQTGDSSSAGLYLCMMFFSTAVVACLLMFLRKKAHKK